MYSEAIKTVAIQLHLLVNFPYDRYFYKKVTQMASINNNLHYLSDPETFNALTEMFSELTWIRNMSEDKVVWFASKANQKKFGIPNTKVGQDFWYSKIHPKDKAQTSANFQSNQIDPNITEYIREYRFKSSNNKWRYIHDKVRFIRNAKGVAIRAVGVWEDITEIKNKERKARKLMLDLKKDRNRFRIISELSNAVMWEEDLKNNELYWTGDEKTLKDFGLNKKYFPTSDWINYIHSEDRDRSAQRYKEAINSEEGIYRDEYRVIKSDGSLAYVIDRGFIIRDKNNVPISAIGGWVDITKERVHQRGLEKSLNEQEELNKKLLRREEELATSEEELRLLNSELLKNNKALTNRDLIITKLQHLAKIGTWEYNPNNDQFIGSPEAYAIQGLTEDYQLNVENLIQYYDEEGKKILVDKLKRARSGEIEPFDLILKSSTPIGKIIWLRLCAWASPNEKGLPSMVGLSYDITQFKETETLLKNSEEKFFNAFHENPDLMILMRKEDLTIIDINSKIHSILAYDRNELMSKRASDFRFFAHQKDRGYFFTHFDKDGHLEMETELIKKDGGHIQALLSFSSFQVGGIPHVIMVIKDISDRKIAEEKFSRVFYNNPDAMMIIRKEDMLMVDVNEKTYPITGYQRSDFLGRSIADFNTFVHPHENEEFWEIFNQHLKVEMEVEWRKKSGQIVHILISMEQLEISGVEHMIAIMRDVSDRKIAEEKFSTIFYHNPDAMMLIRKKGMIMVDVNERSFPITGYNRSEILDKSILDFDMFVNKDEQNNFWNVFEANAKAEAEVMWKKKNGQIIHVMLSMEHLNIGGVDHIIAMIKDISARKSAEERFTKAFNLSPDLMLIFRERDLVLVECNKHVEEISGYKREEIIGRSAMDFDLWANPEDRIKHNELYFNRDNSVFMESIFLRKDKSTYHGNISSKRINLQGEDHMLVIVRDITERKIAEQKIIESEANIYAVINNSNLVVWSVDLDYKVIKANNRFEEFMRENYQVKVVQGQKITPEDPTIDEKLSSTWVPRYERVLAGEKYRVTEKLKDKYIEFSLGPILDNGQFIGIVVFAEDITERIKQEQELKSALNKVVEFKLMALRSVMNPHFFFNALNSIQYFIAQNDRQNAINYLSTFSKLIRGILEHSVSNSITINKEVDQLNNYIVLEQLRFEDKFNYEIVVDKSIDIDNVEIPSLLIQPYVENAIIHGLYNKKEHGFLKISITQENNTILLEVRDNGVGRVAAKNFQDKNHPGHKSLGTAITEERMSLINSQYRVSFEVIDLYNESNEPEGTCVTIRLKS